MTFRIDAALKAELSRLAAARHQSLGALIRDLAQQRLAQEHRQAFVAAADHQARAAAATAQDPDTDEHTVMRELEDDLKAFHDEWR